ncbi:ESF1 homolog [Daktulosphaira vitifoliae]|uniref:ESF1 homolog n=1 Tax=Daktulosphaira vitifoliae TaxID=58002 RepID=UPI0021AAF789|nr:ESF1 homolog [Daktulosphaira vitifoliae]
MDSNDKRWTKIDKDPKFKKIPKSERIVKIDKRFQSIFKDEKFKVKYTIDKRGRPLHRSTTDDFKKFYHMSDEDDDQGVVDDNYMKKKDLNESSSEVEKTITDIDKDDEKHSSKIDKKVRDRLKDITIDYARGDGIIMTDSSSDDDTTSDEESDSVENVDHGWGELDKDAIIIENATSRLALCNMDWDRIQAIDIMILLNSFVPTDGFIKSVTIYPSEFGMKRMEEEEVKGPSELVSDNPVDIGSSDDNSDDEDQEGKKYHMEKLRKYQLTRLKYYYAIIDCDSVETANKIYTECDGIEYESSATRLDLRFVPEDIKFDQEPKEVCDKLPDLAKYKPHLFTTTALQQAKVNLTWDETDPRRKELVSKLKTNPKTEIDDNALQKYVAFSSEDEKSDSENDETNEDNDDGPKKNPIDKYKELLQNIQEEEDKKNNKDMELEISWGIGTQEKVQKTVEEKSKKNLTPFQKMMEKKKEKIREKQKLKKEKKTENDGESRDENDSYDTNKQAELDLLLMDEEPSNKHHFNMKIIQDKSRKLKNKNKSIETIDDFDVDVKDDRFSALYTSHLFNIDPADPKFKRTKGMEAFITEKANRRQLIDNQKVNEPPEKKSKSNINNLELANLLKSVKYKTKNKK